jgi:hypothetical protein
LSQKQGVKNYSAQASGVRADFTEQIKRVVNKKIHETEVLERQRQERMQEMHEARARKEEEKKALEVL